MFLKTIGRFSFGGRGWSTYFPMSIVLLTRFFSENNKVHLYVVVSVSNDSWWFGKNVKTGSKLQVLSRELVHNVPIYTSTHTYINISTLRVCNQELLKQKTSPPHLLCSTPFEVEGTRIIVFRSEISLKTLVLNFKWVGSYVTWNFPDFYIFLFAGYYIKITHWLAI